MRKSNYITSLAILFVSLFLTHTAFADVKVKIRQSVSGQSYENTTYIKGKRQRTEQNMGGMQRVSITQCDLRRSVDIMPQSQTYMINLWEQAPSVAPTTVSSKTQTKTEKGGLVTTTVTTKDTGERKQMFGYTARHLIMTMETESSPDACAPTKSKMQTDGWYIDAAFALDCDMGSYNGYRPNSEKPGCQDRYEVKQVGGGKRGYPVYEKMTMFDASGKETMSFVNEVIELSKTTLDAALFEVPADYREVKSSTELYASMSSGNSGVSGNSGMNSSSSANSNSAMSQNVKNMATKTSNDSAQVGAKKEGVVRIGLANVKTGSVGDGMNAAELAGAIKNTLTEYLKTPKIELVQIDAKLPSAIDEEAKQKECDFVIYANVSHKKGGGGGMFGKMLGNIAGSAVSHVGYGSTAGAIASQTASHAIYTASSAAGNVKSKDELTLEIKVNSTGGATALTKQFKAKAKSDGEDIISPLIEQAAQAIVDKVSK